MKKLFFSFVAAALALALAACGGVKITAITLPGSALTVAVGETAALAPELTYDGAAPETAPRIAWASADEAVAAVDEAGTVTGVAPGETTVTASAGEAAASLTVTVVAAAESLTAEDLSLHLADGAAQARVTVEPAELADQLTFMTGDEAIATVDDSGNVTPVKEGHTGLLILAPDGTRGKAMITVWSGPKELTLAAGKTQVTKGGTVALAAVDETGTAVDAATLSWTSSDENTATVDETGTVKMVGTGEVTITAETAYGVAGSVTLTGKAASTSAGSSTSAAGSAGNVTVSTGGQGSAAAQPTQPAQPTTPDPAPQPQPDPAPQPQPEPEPQPENPSGGHVHDSPEVEFTPGEGGNDLSDFWS